MNKDYINRILKKYPLDRLEQEFERIEKLGYIVVPSEYDCLILKNGEVYIDSDFCTSYHENAALAIDAFWKS